MKNNRTNWLTVVGILAIGGLFAYAMNSQTSATETQVSLADQATGIERMISGSVETGATTGVVETGSLTGTDLTGIEVVVTGGIDELLQTAVFDFPSDQPYFKKGSIWADNDVLAKAYIKRTTQQFQLNQRTITSGFVTFMTNKPIKKPENIYIFFDNTKNDGHISYRVMGTGEVIRKDGPAGDGSIVGYVYRFPLTAIPFTHYMKTDNGHLLDNQVKLFDATKVLSNNSKYHYLSSFISGPYGTKVLQVVIEYR